MAIRAVACASSSNASIVPNSKNGIAYCPRPLCRVLPRFFLHSALLFCSPPLLSAVFLCLRPHADIVRAGPASVVLVRLRIARPRCTHQLNLYISCAGSECVVRPWATSRFAVRARAVRRHECAGGGWRWRWCRCASSCVVVRRASCDIIVILRRTQKMTMLTTLSVDVSRRIITITQHTQTHSHTQANKKKLIRIVSILSHISEPYRTAIYATYIYIQAETSSRRTTDDDAKGVALHAQKHRAYGTPESRKSATLGGAA